VTTSCGRSRALSVLSDVHRPRSDEEAEQRAAVGRYSGHATYTGAHAD